MEDIVFMLKSYRDDYEYYKRLIKSFIKYNSDNIKLYVVVPMNDIQLFSVDDRNVYVIDENEVTDELPLKNKTSFSDGYINQQIIKLSFWELGLCKNYFCIDSDCIFIKYFHKSDFLADGDVPYTIIYDDNELMVDREYYKQYGKYRLRYNRIIKRNLGIKESVTMFSCHGLAIISSVVMKSLKNDYLVANNISYRTMIERAPIEFTWYNYWLQKSRVIPIYPRTPLIKTFHTYSQLKGVEMCGITKEDILRNYYGIVINSNFSRTMANDEIKNWILD